MFFIGFMNEMYKLAGDRVFYVGKEGPARTYVTKVHPEARRRAPFGSMSRVSFRPTRDWQDVPEGAVLPPGLDINMNLATGTKRARLL